MCMFPCVRINDDDDDGGELHVNTTDRIFMKILSQIPDSGFRKRTPDPDPNSPSALVR